MDKIRLDKWLWAARFYKTRSLAADEIGKGRVLVNQQTAKPAREVKVGDQIYIRQEQMERTVDVVALSNVRGPAVVAQTLYQETQESQDKREAERERRRLAKEPAMDYKQGRPTKRERRELENWRRFD
ncbi:MAG: RNA-binding S4 domain-containing protein [Pelistega sp.]|nr:RNA-binding S4 domain-containing protein [Pelistega sp.]